MAVQRIAYTRITSLAFKVSSVQNATAIKPIHYNKLDYYNKYSCLTSLDSSKLFQKRISA